MTAGKPKIGFASAWHADVMMDGVAINPTVLLQFVVTFCMCGLLCQAVATDAP